MALYHAQLGFPASLYLPRRITKLVYSGHALKASETDRYGNFRALLPGCLCNFSIIEAESNDQNFPVKIVVRAKLTTKLDIVLAIRPIGNSLQSYLVKTVWLNHVDDTHKTLRINQYTVVN